MESRSTNFLLWQPLFLSGILGFVLSASLLGLTRKLRSMTQPWVTRCVFSEIPLILRIQRFHNVYLDNFFSMVSFVVSMHFYTAFIPLLRWCGDDKLSRQVTLLLGLCTYIGNSIKDAISAPRPSSPPVRRVASTKAEKENAMEYGFPSTHAVNTVCLFGFLLHYRIRNEPDMDLFSVLTGLSLVVLLVSLVGIGRIYLGMHGFIDVAGGMIIGLVILFFWLTLYGYIDDFITSGQNVTSFWASLSILLFFAYPTPEVPNPSFEYHTAFNGVAFGLISGIRQTYLQVQSTNSLLIFSSQLSLLVFLGRIFVGIPTILAVKFCSKALANWLLPSLCNIIGIPIRSSCYIPALKEFDRVKIESGNKKANYIQRAVSFLPQESYNVDSGIRFLQYVGLSWSVFVLVPYLFSHLNL